MPYYHGEPRSDGEVALCRNDLRDVLSAPKSSDYSAEISRWARLAVVRDDILSFGISVEARIVGQIFLHDWDRLSRESLVGYHLYEEETRGKGIGRRALRLLQQYVADQTDILRLIAITTDDNVASQRICLRNGFANAGPPREDPEHGVVFSWDVERPRQADR